MDSRKDFFDVIERELQLKSMEDWYNVSTEEVNKLGGSGLLSKYYGGSMFKALAHIYPEHDWKAWRFSRVPTGFWQDKRNQFELMEWLVKKLFVSKFEDWYRISVQQIERIVPCRTLFKQESFGDILQSVYPEHDWDINKLETRVEPIKAAQRILFMLLKELFPTSGKCHFLKSHLSSHLRRLFR